MAKTIAQLRAEAQTIKNATIVGENTATRVGGFGEDIVDYLDTEVDNTFATGEAVGDVSLFDELSDLDGKTTSEKHEMIPDGNVVEEVIGTVDSTFERAFISDRVTTDFDVSVGAVTGIMDWYGSVQAYNSYKVSPKISLKDAEEIVASGLYTWTSTYVGLCICASDDSVLYRNTNNSSIDIDLSSYPTASYFRCTMSSTGTPPSVAVTYDHNLLRRATSKTVEEEDEMPVSGNGVYDALDSLNTEITGNIASLDEEITDTITSFRGEIFGNVKTYGQSDCTANTILKADGTTKAYNNYYTSDYISVSTDNKTDFSGVFGSNSNYHGVHFYDANKDSSTAQPYITGLNSFRIDFADYPNVKYFRFCGMNPSASVSGGLYLPDKMDYVYPSVKTLECFFKSDEDVLGVNSSVVGNQNLGSGTPVATSANCACSKTCVLSKLFIVVNKAGAVTIGIGVLDQHMIPVIRSYFTANAYQAGYNTIDISDQQQILYAGEQIFFIYNSESTVQIKYWTSSSEEYADMDCPYGSMSSLGYYGTNYLLLTLAYEAISVESFFAMQSEVEELQSTITSLQESSFIYDESGNPYKLKIVNGSLVPVSQLFRKVVILGNSLTWHNYADTLGWYGRDRSMASTTDDVSWPKLFERILQKKQPTATVTGVLMSAWESAGDGNRDITRSSLSSTKAKLDAALSSDTDLIIYRCGENGIVNDSSVYAEEILDLIDYCLATAPSATVVMCSLFWPNANKDAAIKSAATERRYQYVVAGRAFSSHVEIVGDFMVDSDDGYEKLIGRGHSHTNDVGFYNWTNYLASQLGYSSDMLDELHGISITSSLEHGYKIKEKHAPYKALVTVLVYEETAPTISVTDGSGTSVATTTHQLTDVGSYTYAITFLMPDSDVTVTLS